MSGKENQNVSKQLEWVKTTLEAASFDVSPSLIPGDAESVIAKAVREQGIDMLIMGGVQPFSSSQPVVWEQNLRLVAFR